MNNCLPTIAPNHMILFKIIKDHEGPYQQEAYNGPSKAIGDHMGPYRSRQDNRRPYWTIHMTIQDILARLWSLPIFENGVWLSGYYVLYLRPFSDTHIRNWVVLLDSLWIFWLNRLIYIIYVVFQRSTSFRSGWMVIYVFYVHFRTHISEIWVWLSGYLRYLRPFSHTYIRKLSLVKWLSTLSTSIFGHTYLKLSWVAWFTSDILVKPNNLHYLRCFPKVNQFGKWLCLLYLQDLHLFLDTYI